MAPDSVVAPGSLVASVAGGGSTVVSGNTGGDTGSAELRLALAGGPCTVPTPANGENGVSLAAVGALLAAITSSGSTSSKKELSPAQTQDLVSSALPPYPLPNSSCQRDMLCTQM